MEARVKLLGHPVHQVMIVLPLGLLTAGWIFDNLYWITDNLAFATVAYWNIAAGIVSGLAAAVFGLLDWLKIPIGTRAKLIGAMHGSVNVVMIILFIISWLLRQKTETHAPTGTALLTSWLAVGLASLGGWLGGELVNRYGIGIIDNPSLNAQSPILPKSINEKPAPPTTE